MKILNVKIKTDTDSNVEIIKALEEILQHIKAGRYEGQASSFDTDYTYKISSNDF